ncbi:MAG: NAD(P)/FAD-dependent oxidoreductase, partial [Planctomycetota bacterium]
TCNLSGITLPDVQLTVHEIKASGKRTRTPLIERHAGLLFTHFGFSGPAAMDVSGAITAAQDFSSRPLSANLLPGLKPEQVAESIHQQRGSGGARSIAGYLQEQYPQLPKRLIQTLCHAISLSPDERIAQIPATACRKLAEHCCRLPLPIHQTRGFPFAEVTAGGVDLKEVDPRTMSSRKVDSLYIAGEILDLDGWIGGYNFQSAWSTGHAAGSAAAEA